MKDDMGTKKLVKLNCDICNVVFGVGYSARKLRTSAKKGGWKRIKTCGPIIDLCVKCSDTYLVKK